MKILDINRAKDFKRIKDIWRDKPPVRIAIAALLYAGYEYDKAYQMMKREYDLSEAEFWRNVKIYSLKEVT